MKKCIEYSFLFLFIFCNKKTIAQQYAQGYDTVTNYIHIKPLSVKGGYHPVAFVLKNIDTLGNITWQSEKITQFEKDSLGFFMKLNIPSNVLKNSRQLWCTALIKNMDSTRTIYRKSSYEMNYGGVKLSSIKLILKSTPLGAESFLIPNRIWMDKIEKSNWENDNTIIEKFRINTSSTDTYAFVDETVFVVLYKLNNKYKKVIHFTKPASIEKEQTVWVKFEN
jgi:hypothetical protein